ncbi:L,D-transpeptidase [Actinomycetospora endophytica]|uniref:L,D-transpeptidase n=1 Tax=Actinomycetospora endophytica TaxID=2291215 RepID=UPI0035574A98
MRTTIAGSAVALVGALGITAGLGLSGASGSTGPEAAVAAAAPVALPVASVAPTTTVTAPARTVAPAVAVSLPASTTTTRTASSSSSSSLPCGLTDGACVSISQKRAWLVRGGHVVLSAPITTGRPGERTPPGTFHVTWKDADHRSSEFDDAPMPWSVFFNGGIAFHTGSLSRQSAGCVHLSDSAARTFFRTLHVGDTVVVQR